MNEIKSEDSAGAEVKQGVDAGDGLGGKEAAEKILDKYTRWSFGVGLIPLPAVDMVALIGTQAKMLHEIAKVYGHSFSDNKLRTTIGALVSGAMPQMASGAGASSAMKSVPVLGSAVGMIVMPLASAAATYAIGTVFIKHFESGGTFLNIDLDGMTRQVVDTANVFKSKNAGEAQAEPAAEEEDADQKSDDKVTPVAKPGTTKKS